MADRHVAVACRPFASIGRIRRGRDRAFSARFYDGTYFLKRDIDSLGRTGVSIQIAEQRLLYTNETWPDTVFALQPKIAEPRDSFVVNAGAANPSRQYTARHRHHNGRRAGRRTITPSTAL